MVIVEEVLEELATEAFKREGKLAKARKKN
jgi:hypothetical protein